MIITNEAKVLFFIFIFYCWLLLLSLPVYIMWKKFKEDNTNEKIK